MRDDEEHGRSRRTDPYTSHLAGDHINVNKLEREALEKLTDWPRTSTEIAEFNGRPRDTFSPRMRPLEEKGLVYRHGVKPCRNPSGRIVKMITWALTPKGRAFLGLRPLHDPPPSPSLSPADAGGPKRPDGSASAQASLLLDDSDR